MHGSFDMQHACDSAGALVERLMQRREADQARHDSERPADYETDWDAWFAAGRVIEKANHGTQRDDWGKPGDDPYTAARREGVEAPLPPELPGWHAA